MGNIWGKNITLSIFGESHGEGVGIIIGGLPSGILIDHEYIYSELRRRAPIWQELSTTRGEDDKYEIKSGVLGNRTNGCPLCCFIKNKDARSSDYIKGQLRPGHADFTGYIKYGEYFDYCGGGHFSGRLTAPLVFAGAVFKSILKTGNIFIGSHIKQIGNVYDSCLDYAKIDKNLLLSLSAKKFPVVSDHAGNDMKKLISAAKENGDSIGGLIECFICGLPAGVGEPFFDSLESRIASLVFSVPAVKGIDFGAGFGFAHMKGSTANDEFFIDNKNIQTHTNNNGGINGGISNGMPVVFSAVIKPTSSIAVKQASVDFFEKKEIELQISGRHDPCIAARAAVIIEACAATAVIDLMQVELR